MERFTQCAFREGWIEAENRSGKSAIAFCAGFPETKESRIFMTYEGSFMNLLTLAHELGHAFHNHALKDEPGLWRKYPMSLAETASTFAELIVIDSALSEARSDHDRLFLLDEKIKRSTMNFMHIQARFLFEQRLCEERKNGPVPAPRINRLMASAFDEAYAGSLDEQPAHAWIATPHFYITAAPFYNFPYTFGYLFAVSLYARACEEGPGFESRYLALLRDSGKMPAEELVWKHLEEDITQPAFWEKGMALCLRDIEAFIRLAEHMDAAAPNS
jgi:oligoendopeptidase F